MTPETTDPLPAATDNPDEFPAANGHTDRPSALDGIRSIREQRVSEEVRQIDLDVPGYEHRLAVIYRYPEDGYGRLVKAVEDEDSPEPNARLESACIVLVACCVAVVGRNESGALIDLATDGLLGPGELPESPMRFERKLAEALQIDVPSEVERVGRFVVRQLFSPRGQATGVYDGDLALISTANVVFNWANGVEVRIDEDVSGE